MQWIALDTPHTPIPAPLAIKQKRYLCPECACPVQLRSGPHRQPHFYHLRANSTCTQHKKSEQHLGLQLFLASRIPVKEMQIERRFPQINRIADVAWEARKIVFEIQCSPMTCAEAENRCRDYRSIGWEILWILSDARFNKRRLSAAENYLRQETSYFFHWSKQPLISRIYDQCEIVKGFRRVYKGPPIPIDPLLIIVHHSKDSPEYALPLCIKQRWDAWKLRVDRDLLTQAQEKEPRWLIALRKIENRLESQKSAAERLPWHVLLKRCYIQVLKKILRSFVRPLA